MSFLSSSSVQCPLTLARMPSVFYDFWYLARMLPLVSNQGRLGLPIS